MFSIDTSRRSRSISKSKSVALNTTKSTTVIRNKPQLLTRLYDLPKIPSYYKIDRPTFNKEAKRDIEEKLKLNKTVQISTSKRIKNNNLFVKYKDNPFLNKTQTIQQTVQFQVNNRRVDTRDFSIPFYEKKREKSYTNIVQGVNDIRTPNVIVKNLPEDHNKIRPEEVSSRIQSTVKVNSQNHHIIQKKESLPEEPIKDQMSFDDIVNIKEDNYYVKHQKSINIFSLLHGEPDILDSSILDRFYFSYVSHFEKREKYRAYTNRDLSQKARTEVKKMKFKKEELQDLNVQNIPIDFNKINFEDIMSVATGRCTPQTLQTFMFKDRNKSDFNVSKEDDIRYKQNLKHKINNCVFDHQDLVEVKYFLNMETNQDEIKYAEKCQRHRQQILEHVGTMKKMNKMTIKDRNLHQELTDKMKKDILQCLTQDTKKKANNRSSKLITKDLSKSKAMTLKARELISTLRTIKQEEKQGQFLNKGKAGSNILK